MFPCVKTGVGVSIANDVALWGAPFLPESLALFAAMTTTPTEVRKVLINNTISGLIDAGVWAKRDVYYFIAAETKQAGQLNWKRPGTHTCTEVATCTFVADRSVKGDGVTGYWDTNYDPAADAVTLAENDNSIGFWNRSDIANNINQVGWYDGTDGFAITPRASTPSVNGLNFRNNQAARSATGSQSVQDGTGWFYTERTGVSTTGARRNDVALNVTTSANQAATALNSGSLRIGSSTATSFSPSETSAFAAGGSLTEAERAAEYSIVTSYMEAVGAAPTLHTGASAASLFNTVTFDSIGFICRTGADELTYFYRQDVTSTPTTASAIYKRKYAISTNTWGSASLVYSDATYGANGCGGGVVDGKIFLFFALCDEGAANFIDFGFISSTDGLVGDTWSARTLVPTTYDRYNGYGKIAATADPNTFVGAFYEHKSGATDPWRLSALRTTDAGANWSLIEVYDNGDSGGQLGETTVEHIGDGKLIMLARHENTPWKLWQSVSFDSGATWSAPVSTNIGGGTDINHAWMYYDSVDGKLWVLLLNRGALKMQISRSDALAVFNNPLAYDEPYEYRTLAGIGRGYGSIEKTNTDNEMFVLYTDDLTSTDCDAFGGRVTWL